MSDSLYRTLKVRRNASPDAIAKAYRRRAKETHPDRGGDRADFEAVDLAFRVLSDASARAEYDRTGEVKPPQPDDSWGQAAQLLAGCLANVIQAATRQGASVASLDLVEVMRDSLEERLKNFRQQRSEGQKLRKAMAEAAERFETDGEDNFLRLATLRSLDAIDAEMKAIDRQEKQTNDALEMLKKYRYRFIHQPQLYTTGASFAWK